MKKTLLLTILTLALCACDELMPGNKGSSTPTYTNTTDDDQRNWLRDTKKLALIIGNADYPGSNSLCINSGNCPPVNDAQDLAEALRDLGFGVIMQTDLGLRAMEKAIDDFGKNITSGDYDVALVHFSGHGSEVKGENYLYPIDATPESPGDARYECVNVNKIIGKMDVAALSTRILLLDACRNNPYEKAWRRDQSQVGLAFINTPANTFIGFATSPGATASNLSRNRRNGLYTEAILQHIRRPNRSIDQIFNSVANTVADNAKALGIKPQIPFKLSSLRRDFYFGTIDTNNTVTITKPIPPATNLDTDGDGLINDKDQCPNEAGPIENKGCPDSDTDGDGIIDRLDDCPNKKGEVNLGGCPPDPVGNPAHPGNGTDGNSPMPANGIDDGEAATGDLGERNIIRRPSLVNTLKQDGLTTIYVCADKYGRITKAQAVKSQSTIKDNSTLLSAARVVKSEMRFSPGKGTDCMYYKVRIEGSEY